jgi:hypothetical protein
MDDTAAKTELIGAIAGLQIHCTRDGVGWLVQITDDEDSDILLTSPENAFSLSATLYAAARRATVLNNAGGVA